MIVLRQKIFWVGVLTKQFQKASLGGAFPEDVLVWLEGGRKGGGLGGDLKGFWKEKKPSLSHELANLIEWCIFVVMNLYGVQDVKSRVHELQMHFSWRQNIENNFL